MSPSAPLLFGTWLLVWAILLGPLLAVDLWLQRRAVADERWRVVLPMVVVGLLAYAACIAFYLHPTLGRIVVVAAVCSTWVDVVRRLRRGEFPNPGGGLIVPLCGAAAIGLAYLVLLYLPQLDQSYVMQSAARFVHQLPPDPDLPELFGNRLYTGQPIRPFASDWLSSDRPPLQTGFYLLVLPWTCCGCRAGWDTSASQRSPSCTGSRRCGCSRAPWAARRRPPFSL